MTIHADATSEHYLFPNVLRRVQAGIIDSVIIACSFFGAALIASQFDFDSTFKILFVTLVVIAMEPGFVSITGSSIGHHIRGMRVEDADNSRNLDLLRAILRFVIKVILGLPSLAIVTVTKKHQAIHDVVCRSVVVVKDPSSFPASQVSLERKFDSGEYEYPSVGKRVAVILAYFVVTTVLAFGVIGAFISDQCIDRFDCSATEDLISSSVGAGWFVFVSTTTVLGWQSRLWGCGKRLAPSSS